MGGQAIQDGAAKFVESETGAFRATGAPGLILAGVALAWSSFQVWIASPLPFIVGFGVFNETEARSIHLAFAIFLAFAAFPARKGGRCGAFDWALGAAAAFSAAYLFLFHEALSARPGLPTTMDLAVGIGGAVLLLEATRRALGPPLMVVAGVFLAYVFLGPYAPDVIAHKGASLAKTVSHQWLGTEGVFGVPLGVSTSFVFLFVLFGAIMERAGAGQWFIAVAFSLLGHMRGGPAKAAVVSSALTGLISGSSIANVVTTGTFTIPLMKKVGFPPEKAGAIEVASSTNGQLTPPIMGAAAFLMIEYVGISYIEVIKHAFLPAVISYVALVYIVHLEAMKAGMKGLARPEPPNWIRTAIAFAGTVVGMGLLTAAVYWGLGWIKGWAGAASPWIAAGMLALAYALLVGYAARFPEPVLDDVGAEGAVLPRPGPTIKSGLYFLLPAVVLVWCLAVERLSPGLSAFWGAMAMAAVALTHKPLKAALHGAPPVPMILEGAGDALFGMIGGARNMVGIGVATAAAGIVVGSVTLTGIGLVMTEFVEFISGGNLILILVFTAMISLILGMGLPTTANYIVVSTLMAPVIVGLGAEAGLVVPLIAAHMFVFYFGILADDTPPVGLAAYAAAAISGGDPIRTGLQGFAYDIRTAILPFLFIFNTELLLIGITGPGHLAMTITMALAAMMLFAAATQGWFLVRSRWWETAALLLVAFTLFRPGFWLDMAIAEFEPLPPARIEALAGAAPKDGTLRLRAVGEDNAGDVIDRTVLLPLGGAGSGAERLARAGLELSFEDDGGVVVDAAAYASPAADAGLDMDWRILAVEVERDRPPRQIAYLPALALFGLVTLTQWRRRAIQQKSLIFTDD